MKTKVLHIIGTLQISGAANVSMNAVRYMDNTKFQCDYLVFDEGGHYEEEAKSLGAKIIKIDEPKKGYLKYLTSISKIIKEGGYDVVHSHTTLNSGMNMMIAWLSGVSVRISHSHTTSSGRGRSCLSKVYELLMKTMIRIFSTDLIACSMSASNYLFGSCVNQKNIKILKNGIDLDKFSYNPAIRKKVRKTMNLDKNIVIGHVGRFTKVKNHEFIIDVFEEFVKHEDGKLILVGDGELKENIKEYVKEKGLSDKVVFTGNRDDIETIMQAMDVFLMPSFYEGFPMVLVEAQALGLPCVVSSTITPEVNITGLVEFVELTKTELYWTSILKKSLREKKRSNYGGEIKDAGFDISMIISDLEDVYRGKDYVQR